MTNKQRNIVWCILSAIVAAFALGAYNAKAEDVCADVSTLAEKVMEARQIGVPMSKMMESDLALVKRMVVSAYEEPRYSTSRHQKRSMEDFRDRWYLGCVKAHE